MSAAVGTILLIGLGGILGANTRYLISVWAARRYGASFPYGTFIVNLSGSVLIGCVLAFIGSQPGQVMAAHLLLVTGFLGAYTTFSTFTFETMALLRQGTLRAALINVLGSTALGVGGAAAGYVLVTLVTGRMS